MVNRLALNLVHIVVQTLMLCAVLALFMAVSSLVAVGVNLISPNTPSAELPVTIDTNTLAIAGIILFMYYLTVHHFISYKAYGWGDKLSRIIWRRLRGLNPPRLKKLDVFFSAILTPLLLMSILFGQSFYRFDFGQTISGIGGESYLATVVVLALTLYPAFVLAGILGILKDKDSSRLPRH